MKKDFIVYKESNKFAAWPAGYICESWGEEILASYLVCDYLNTERGHHFIRENPWYVYTSRSTDNGNTWSHEKTNLDDPAPSQQLRCPEIIKDFEGKLDFTHPDMVLFFNMSGAKDFDYSWWNYSTDRGKTWSEPYHFPKMEGFDLALNMRTAYIVLNSDEILVFGSCQKSTGREGNTFCAKMKDGGRSMEFLSWIGPEYANNGFNIMPQALRREDGTIVCFVRSQETVSAALFPRGEIYYISQYESSDEGKTWTYVGNPVMHHGGNPPAPAIMKDGTWVLVYGYRRQPRGIRCKYSEDQGKTWSKEIILRDDAFTGDTGYPKITALEDGSIFVCYYIGTYQGEEQHIEATIFDKEFLKTGK